MTRIFIKLTECTGLSLTEWIQSTSLRRFNNIHFSIILPSTPKSSFQTSRPKLCTHLSLLRSTQLDPPISVTLSLLSYTSLVKCTNHERYFYRISAFSYKGTGRNSRILPSPDRVAFGLTPGVYFHMWHAYPTKVTLRFFPARTKPKIFTICSHYRNTNICSS